jgi:DNA-binding transcriptional ArsR family regulator
VAETKKKRARRKRIEDVISFALAHPIRIEILTLLNEAIYTPNQLAQVIGEPLHTINHHVNELANDGAIELARTENVGNWVRHYYHAVRQPYVSNEEALRMTPQQRQVMAGVTLQCAVAEAMAALRAGNMVADPSNVFLSWRWFNVDREGQKEIISEVIESWKRVQEIEARSTARRIESGEPAVTVIVASQSFPRRRGTSSPPWPLEGDPL